MTSSTMLNRSSESGHPHLAHDLRAETFNISPLMSMMLAVDLSCIAIIMLRYVPSMPNLFRVIMKGY